MSKKTSPTLIGAFVIGAVALLAISVALFGGSQLFAERLVLMAYFSERTQGLRVGANVTMNGARIGYVSKVVLMIDESNFQSTTEVTMEILPESWVVVEEGVEVGKGAAYDGIPLAQLISVGGLRAQVQTESLVTGQLLIDLSFQPDTPIKMRGVNDPKFPEIPTIPSNVERIVANFQKWVTDLTETLDPAQASSRIQSILHGLDELANSQDLRESLAGASSIINEPETQQLSTSLEATLNEFRGAAAEARALLRNADSSLDTDLKPVIASLAVTLEETRRALAAATVQLRGESIQSSQFGGALREVEGAAKALREFLDYLERNPEAILKGKKQ